MKYFLLTNDVEITSIVRNGFFEDMGERVLREGLPPLLDLMSKYSIQGTFFFTGDIAQSHPETVRLVADGGHEVASHGLRHDDRYSFDVMTLDQQIEHLKTSKKILEDISGQEVISFRAPALRVNRNTPVALAEAGFRIDSSIAPQRMDIMFTFGTRNKLKWLFAPRTPYRTRHDQLARRGDGPIIEIPVSAFGIPYIGTTLRIMPGVVRCVRRILKAETALCNRKPVAFLFHPTEIISEELPLTFGERGSNPVNTLFASRLRRNLKVRNLGPPALNLLENEIIAFKDYKFVSLKAYAQQNGLL